MKKYLSLILIFTFIVSAISALPISAATGTDIGDASSFASMSQSGTYYLSKDITISAAYAKEFKGTLDGNGHTITLSGAKSVFSKLTGATVKNLKIVGTVTTDTAENLGLLAPTANGTFTNLSSNANITISEKADKYNKYAGTLIGTVTGKSTVTNCTPYGSITLKGTTSGSGSLGGLIGAVSKAGAVVIDGCHNYATIDNELHTMNNGGIIGTSQGSTQLTLKNCVNFATVNGTSGNHSGSAGIIGMANGSKNPLATVAITSCVNFGLINDNKSATANAQSHHIGGILGRGYGMPDLTIDKCLNVGDIVSLGGGWASAGGIAGGIMTYGYSWVGTHAGTVKVTNCINSGRVINGAFTGGIIGGVLQFNTNGCSLTVDKCANYGELSGKNIVGGIIGECGEDAISVISITNCYNDGSVSSEGTRGAGILGMLKPNDGNNNVTEKASRIIENCVNAGDIFASSQTAAILGGTDKSAVTLKNCANVGNLMSAASYQLAPKTSGITQSGNSTIRTPMSTEPYVKTVNSSTASAKASTVKALVPSEPHELLTLLKACFELEESEYTGGWSDFIAKKNAAILAIVDFTATDEISKAHSDLKTALTALKLKTSVDKTKINSAIVKAMSLESKLSAYTKKSQSEFERAYAWALAVRQANSSQALIDKACDGLNAAIDALYEIAEKSSIVTAVEKYKGYYEESYMSSSWEAFGEAYRALLALYRMYEVSQPELEEAIEALEAAEKLLVKRGDMFALQSKLDEIAEKYPKQNYVEGTYDALQAELDSTSSLLVDQKFSEPELEALFARFDAAIANLVKKADLSEIDTILDGVSTLNPKDYTPESWAKLTSVVEKISEKRGTSGTEAEVAALKGELEAALDSLVGFADYSMHDEIIAEFSATYKEGYTDESVARVEAAIAKITELKAKSSTTAEVAKEALAELSRAVATLEVKEVGSLIEDEPDAPTSSAAPTTPTTESKGCGGTLSVSALALVALLGAAVVAKKKED